MADAVFEERRLAEIYDPLDRDRGDLVPYVAMVEEFGARSVLDIGCGTGTFACLLAGQGLTVTGVDPAAASVTVARTKPHADRVQWIVGDATSLPGLQVDLVTMTGNVAQVFVSDEAWTSTLRAASSALGPGGHLVFEARDPDREAWKEWTRPQTYRRVELPGVGLVETWVDLLDVSPPLVAFRWTFVFEADGAVFRSDSTLRFRTRREINHSLAEAGFAVEEIREAADRPAQEFVVIAKPAESLAALRE
jgi:SAM-dependent methyltransferase